MTQWLSIHDNCKRLKMSITSFIKQPANAARLKILRPPPPRTLGVPIIVPPRSKRYSLIGTAFDYLLRFEIKRRAPHASMYPWVAKSAIERLFRQVKEGEAPWRSVIPDDQLAAMAPIVAGESLNGLDDYISLVPMDGKPGDAYHDSLGWKRGQNYLTNSSDPLCLTCVLPNCFAERFCSKTTRRQNH